MKVIVLFTSYYFADKADKVLMEAVISHQMIATPPALHHCCGLCVLFDKVHLKEVLLILQKEKVSHSGMYEYLGPTSLGAKISYL